MTDIIENTHRQIIVYNKDIGHAYGQNLNARVINDDGGYYIKTNSLGFRSNIEFEKKKEKKRILFFGDSNTAADGVSNDDRFSDIVGRHFDAEIYNFAISGTGTDQQYLIWEKYAKDIEADLIVIGSLVENIERNKVQYRENINFFTKKRTLTPKPFFLRKNDELVLKNNPVPRFNEDIKDIDPKIIQWLIPRGQKYLYKFVNSLRNNIIYQNFDKKFEDDFTKLRSFLIRKFYQPYKDYENPGSNGYKLLHAIFKKFIFSIKRTPVILLPIPTYHYYFDEAKPVYKNLYNSFHDPKNKIYVLDLLSNFKKLDIKERQSLCLKKDKSHFSKTGHEIIATCLSKEISDLKILSPKIISKEEKKSSNQINKPKYILGISAFYHDSAATLLEDDRIISAVQEERFTRIKNDKSFPINAINYCLEEAGIHSNDLDAIIYYDNAYLTLERIMSSYLRTKPSSINTWIKSMPKWLQYKFFIPNLIRKNLKYSGKILHNLHHRSHLASAFFPSPFQKAAILAIDGVGEWATASIGLGEANKIEMIKDISYPNSVGLVYSAFTQFIGFKVNSGEYKMMGLAPYGKPKYVDLILNNLVDLKEDGSITVNQKYFSYSEGTVMTNKFFADLFGGEGRKPETKITQREMDIACSIQKVTERIIFNMASYAKKITNAEYLCMSGGVALNCVANGFLLKTKLFKDIWIQPAAGDAGSSLGCAYDAYFTYFKNKRNLGDKKKSFQSGSLLGPYWKKEEIKSFLETAQIEHEYIEEENQKNKLLAHHLNNGKVIAIFFGRTEFGPRALGSRSIIADPRNKEMQTRLNLKIKFRESFRPFAPAVLNEKKEKYFQLNKESPYMMLVAPVAPERRLAKKELQTEDMLKIVKEVRSDIPAVTHVDYSARIQTISKNYNEKFYNLVKEFENQTGCSVVINTSFNVRGEPIVNSPSDAYRCFMNTDIDILALENFVIYKNKQQKNNFDNWKILKKREIKYKKDIFKKNLIEIYNKFKKVDYNDKTAQSGWSNCKPVLDFKKIFEISNKLDSEDYDSNEMSKKIVECWIDKKFGEEMRAIIIDLLELSKKFERITDYADNTTSDNMYEMF